jgi:hypothetical protein
LNYITKKQKTPFSRRFLIYLQTIAVVPACHRCAQDIAGRLLPKIINKKTPQNKAF